MGTRLSPSERRANLILIDPPSSFRSFFNLDWQPATRSGDGNRLSLFQLAAMVDNPPGVALHGLYLPALEVPLESLFAIQPSRVRKPRHQKLVLSCSLPTNIRCSIASKYGRDVHPFHPSAISSSAHIYPTNVVSGI